MNEEREKARIRLIREIRRLGHPEEFGIQIAANLRTEKAMNRMSGYLSHYRRLSPETIADEMLAIMEERQMWINKKTAEYYNSKCNEHLLRGFGDEDE